MYLKHISLTPFGKLFLIGLAFTLLIGIPTYKFVMSPYRVMKRAFATMNIDHLEWAIKKGVDVNQAIKNVRPVVLSIRHGRYDFLEAICKAGAELNLTGHRGVSLAGQVATLGDSTALNILGKHGADFHAKADTLGHNVLTSVLTKGKTNLFPVAVKYTKRNAQDHNGGRTPLHYADYLSEETTDYLITEGEDPNARDAIGNTPMHTIRYEAIAKRLHECGADINAVNDCLVPAIFYQVGNGNGRVYQYMLSNGAEVDRTDEYGQSILTYAMMTENELLHRQVADNYCEHYPDNCEKAQKHLKNAGIKALATLVYTHTAHRAIMNRIAAKQAAKGAIRRGMLRQGAGKLFFKAIPLIGWVSAIYDGVKITEELAEANRRIRAHEAEAIRLAKKRREARKLLREQFLTCNVEVVPPAKTDTSAAVAAH